MKTFRSIANAIATFLKIVCKFSLLLPLLYGMVWFNFKVDRSGIFQGERFEREVAQALLSGNNVSGNEQMDERKINALYVQYLQQPVETIALGSSRILQLNKEIAQTDSFYNFGMVGADFKDILGTFYLLDRADKLPQNMIIGLDPWLLNPNDNAIDSRSDKELYEEFLQASMGIASSYQPPNKLDKYSVLFSPSYFQGNLEYYFRDTTLEKRPAIVTQNLYAQLTDVKCADGSILYNQEFRGKTQEQVNHDALTEAVNFLRMDNFTEPDPSLCNLFEKFIVYAQSKGVHVVFVMVPYQPVLYSYVTEHAEEYPGFFASALWYKNFAIQHNIPLYGDYNPYTVGCWYNDYYDGNHIKGTALEQIFPGIAATQNASGLQAPALVPYETAERIVAQLNEIEAPETLAQGDDVTIDGVACYQVLRYSPKATLLARYAISQETGVFYRYDSSAKHWVVDPRF